MTKIWMPSQVALLLGVQQVDILSWIDQGELKADRSGKVTKIKEEDLVEYLHNHPEHVGRVYCDDIPGALSDFRKKIVDELEELNECRTEFGK